MATATSAPSGQRAAPAAPRSRRPPPWVYLCLLVLGSVVVRYAFARRMPAPWIMIDELVYSELARSFAETGTFALRGERAGGSYGVVYPLLISPAWAIFDAAPTAYAAAKAINSVLMSLAAVPAYLLARRVVARPLALVAAALTVAVPSTLYAGTIMTENAFYPVFLAAVLALVLALERPTWLRALAVAVAIGIAYLTRAQALALAAAAAVAPLLFVAFRSEGLRAVRRFVPIYAALAGAAVVAVASAVARGRDAASLLGAYRGTTEQSYDFAEVARWLGYHAAELDLYVGVVPVAALLVLVAGARGLPRRDAAFLAATVSVAAVVLVVVAAFASRYAQRIEERNTFYLAPLLLIALLVWIERGTPRPRRLAAVAAAVAAAAPAFVPYERLINVTAQSDTLALLPLWEVHEAFVPLDWVWLFVLALGVVLAFLFLVVPRPLAVALPAAIFALYALSLYPIEAGEHGIRQASVGALFQGMRNENRDWIDSAVGRKSEVTVIWSGRSPELTVWEHEFFNESVGRVFHTGRPLPGGLPQQAATINRGTGVLFAPDGSTVAADAVFADESLELAGVRLARDERRGMEVVRTGGEVRTQRLVDGLYDDGWSAPRLTYTRYRCQGGTLTATLGSDENLFDRPQTVTGTAGRSERRVRVPTTATTTLRLPLAPRGGTCVATFTVTPTAVPAAVQPGSGDTRRLGARFLRFDYEP